MRDRAECAERADSAVRHSGARPCRVPSPLRDGTLHWRACGEDLREQGAEVPRAAAGTVADPRADRLTRGEREAEHGRVDVPCVCGRADLETFGCACDAAEGSVYFAPQAAPLRGATLAHVPPTSPIATPKRDGGAP
jgi:hypothetical protein